MPYISSVCKEKVLETFVSELGQGGGQRSAGRDSPGTVCTACMRGTERCTGSLKAVIRTCKIEFNVQTRIIALHSSTILTSM